MRVVPAGDKPVGGVNGSGTNFAKSETKCNVKTQSKTSWKVKIQVWTKTCTVAVQAADRRAKKRRGRTKKTAKGKGRMARAGRR